MNKDNLSKVLTLKGSDRIRAAIMEIDCSSPWVAKMEQIYSACDLLTETRVPNLISFSNLYTFSLYVHTGLPELQQI